MFRAVKKIIMLQGSLQEFTGELDQRRTKKWTIAISTHSFTSACSEHKVFLAFLRFIRWNIQAVIAQDFKTLAIIKGSLVRNFRSYEQLDSLVKW